MSEFSLDHLFDPTADSPASGPHGVAETVTQANEAILRTQRRIIENEDGRGPLLTRSEAEHMFADLRKELLAVIEHKDR